MILRPVDYDLWLDPGVTDPTRVTDCLGPFDSKLMKKYSVSTRVNRPEKNDAECAREISLAGRSEFVLTPSSLCHAVRSGAFPVSSERSAPKDGVDPSPSSLNSASYAVRSFLLSRTGSKLA